MSRPKLLLEYTSELGLVEGQRAYSAALEAEEEQFAATASGISAAVAGIRSRNQAQTASVRAATARTAYVARTQLEVARARRFAAQRKAEIDAEAEANWPQPPDALTRLQTFMEARQAQQPEPMQDGVAPPATIPAPVEGPVLGVEPPAWSRNMLGDIATSVNVLVNNWPATEALAYADTRRVATDMTANVVINDLVRAGALSVQQGQEAHLDPELVPRWEEWMKLARSNNANVTIPSVSDLDTMTDELWPYFRALVDQALTANGNAATS